MIQELSVKKANCRSNITLAIFIHNFSLVGGVIIKHDNNTGCVCMASFPDCELFLNDTAHILFMLS